MNGRGVGDSEKPVSNAGAAAAVIPVDAGPDLAAPDSAHGTPTPESGARDRRSAERIEVMWSVDCETEETFLYAAITNISAMGIFVQTTEPLPVGTRLTLRFASPHAPEAFVLSGMVQWVNRVRPREDNPNPGMGIRFSSLSPADRERIVDTIRTIAYLREEPKVMDLAEGGN